jgi:alpha-L-rhamnosidase
VTHDTVHGQVEVRWQVTDGEMRLDVTIPHGTTATVEPPMHPEIQQVGIGGGSHTWRYRLPVEEKPNLTLDTPLRTLAADPGVRRAIAEVFDRHLPGIPIDSEAPEAASVSLNDILGYIPSVSAEFRDELSGALARAREGTQ